MGLERLVRSRLGRGLLVASVLGYAAVPAAAATDGVAHAAAAKTKTKACGQGTTCTASLSSRPPTPTATSPGGGGGSGGGGGGGVTSPSPPPAPTYSVFNVHARARSTDRLQPGSKLVEALDAGHKLVCPGYTRKDKRSWFEFMLAAKTQFGITYQITDVIHNRTAKGVHFCAGLGYRFKTLSGRPARHAKLPNGEPGWIGLLPDCERDSTGAVTSTGPCVLSTEQSGEPGNISTTLTVQIPAMSLSDPWGAG
jgi:hypothetical protein